MKKLVVTVAAAAAVLSPAAAAADSGPDVPANVNHVTFDPSLAEYDSNHCQIGDGFELSREVTGLTATIMAIDTSGPHLVYSIEVSWDGTNTGLAQELSQNGAPVQSNGAATFNLTALTATNNFWAIVQVNTLRSNVNNPIVNVYPQHVEVTFGPCQIPPTPTTTTTTSPPALPPPTTLPPTPTIMPSSTSNGGTSTPSSSPLSANPSPSAVAGFEASALPNITPAGTTTSGEVITPGNG